MSSLSEKLSDIETRLQTLIEEGTTRILPEASKQAGISSKLVAAMQSSNKFDESGQHVAADLYILMVDVETAQLLVDDPSLIEELSELILAVGTESGLRFPTTPRIKISADAKMEPGNFKVMAQFSLQEFDETNTLTTSADDAYPVPDYAFLIINGAQIFPLTQQVVNLGRRIDNHVVIENLSVSRVHAQIRAIKGHYVIFDLDSSGGTFVNSVRLTQATLYPGDVISLAGVDIVYGQDASFMSRDDRGSTQKLNPFPETDE